MLDGSAASTSQIWTSQQLFAVLQAFSPLAMRQDQLSPEQILVIAGEILARPQANVLIYGLGEDTPFWCAINPHGRTVFVEDDDRWVKQARAAMPQIEVHRVHYDCRREQWQDRPVFPLGWPKVLSSILWDVILIDGPRGFQEGTPGRQQSIWSTAQIRKPQTTIFVHDYERALENRCAEMYLTPQPDLVIGTQPTLALYGASMTGADEIGPKMEEPKAKENQADNTSNAFASTYPGDVMAIPSAKTLENIKAFKCRHIAEIGILHGATSIKIAQHLKTLPGETSLHLFDFQDRVDLVTRRIIAMDYPSVVGYGNSYKLADSYNWSLMTLLKKGQRVLFDYVYLDGAHTWAVDGFAFFLLDLLLQPGGYIEFDDYHWSLATSRSLRPTRFPMTAQMYSPVQIAAQQVALVVDVLVKGNPRYVPIESNRTYQKVS